MYWQKILGMREKYERYIIAILLGIVVVISIMASSLVDYFRPEDAISYLISIVLFCVFLLADDVIDIKNSIDIQQHHFSNDVINIKNSIDTQQSLLLNDIASIKKSIENKQFLLFDDHEEIDRWLREYILNNDLSEIRLIEYSSVYAIGLIRSLIKHQKSPQIYLLIQHPKVASDVAGQEKRIWNQITEIIYQQSEFRDYPNLKILCYKQKASVRGRTFGDKLVTLGWYIYKYESDKGDKDNKLRLRVYGHTQPMIALEENSVGFVSAKNSFNDVFENLWMHGTRLSEVCKEYENDARFDICLDDKFISWCDKVSPTKEDRQIVTRK